MSVDEELEFKEMIKDFIWSIGPIFVVGLLISALVYGGIFAFYIPGFLIAPILFILPFMYNADSTIRKLDQDIHRFLHKQFCASVDTNHLLVIYYNVNMVWRTLYHILFGNELRRIQRNETGFFISDFPFYSILYYLKSY